MEINEQAPVVAEGIRVIEAEPDTVWRIMADIDHWPEWNPEVSSAHLDGDLVPGATFHWKAGPGTIISTLKDVEPPWRIAWTGITLGISAIHVWELEQGRDITIVRTRESWDGITAHILRGALRDKLQRGIINGLRGLKCEAERRGRL